MNKLHSHKFNKAHIIPLLLQYKQYPSLWNPKDIRYKNHAARTRILKKISHDLGLGMTLGQMRGRFKNLRTTYVREVNRIMKTEKMGEVHTPRLRWFAVADSFLRDVVVPRGRRELDTESNDSPYEEAKVSTARTEYLEDNFINADVEVEGIVVKEENVSEEDYLQSLEEISKSENSTNINCDFITDSIQNNPNNVTEYGTHVTTNSGDNFRSMPKQISQSTDDEFDTFGRHVANQLRSLPLRHAIQSQNYIHIFLTEERLKFLDKKT